MKGKKPYKHNEGNMAANDDNELFQEEELKVASGPAKFAAVELATGEEKFTAIFKQKSKLYRFDEGENTWKERGAGEARVLQHKEKPSRHMFVFRRDGIGKLAAQHDLVKGMKIKPYPGNDKMLLWNCWGDLSDGPEEDDAIYEDTFAIRFPSPELAKEFSALFETVTKE